MKWRWRVLEKAEIILAAKQWGREVVPAITTWRAETKGYSYIITLELDGFRASAKPLGSIPTFDRTTTRQDLCEGLTSFTEAERHCIKHSKGKRDA